MMVDEDFTILEQVPSVVHINVGGQLFLTSRATLYKVPESLLCRMFQGDVPVNKVRQNDSTYFVDRDPTHFQRVLNYMRDGRCVLPAAAEACQELLAEARHYQIPGLVAEIEARLRVLALAESAPSGAGSGCGGALAASFRALVLAHHVDAGDLDGCLAALRAFVAERLVKITPVTDVADDNRLLVFWLSASMPPSTPTAVAFRYRGDRDSHDIGVKVAESDPSFQHWCRVWDIYHNRQLLAAFKAIAQNSGLKIVFNARVETFKQDNQLDVVWKMYRVKCLSLSISSV